MPIKLFRRGKVWHYRGTVAGRRLRGSCQTTDKAIAERQAAEIEGRQWKGHFDGPAAVLTFAQAALKYRAAGKSTRFLEPIEDYFRDTLVKDINAGSIIDMAIQIYPNYTPLSRNRAAIGPAQAIINYAAELELCQPVKVKRFKGKSEKKTPATAEWVADFQAHATSPYIGALCLFMYLTGARVGEACQVEWRDVNLQERWVRLNVSKGGEDDPANLPVPLVVVLSNLEHVNGRPVFWYDHRDNLKSAWKATIEAAGIEPLTPHCCRHGFATDLLRKGVDVITVAKLGRWKSAEQVLRTYGHAQNNPRLTDLLSDNQEEKPNASNRNEKRNSSRG
jgi:integrase